MTGRDPAGDPPARALLEPFPVPPPLVEHAFHTLTVAETGTDPHRHAVGDPARLPRPWNPAAITDPHLRAQIWDWLETVVVWINTQYTWDPEDLISPCWPRHPHIVRELAVIADQYRRAEAAVTSIPLEEWHRYTLPMFLDRTRRRQRGHCDDGGHKPSPSHGQHTRHTSGPTHQQRHDAYRDDITALTGQWHPATQPPARTRHIDGAGHVDLDTGLIHPE